MTQRILGTRLTDEPSSYLVISGSTNNQRAISHQTFQALDGSWMTHIGGWMRGDGTAKVIFGAWLRDDDGEPTTLLARTAAYTLPTEEAEVGGPIVWTNPALPFQTVGSLLLTPGQRPLVGFLIYDGDAEIGTVLGSTSAQYLQTVGTEMVTNPFLGSSVVALQTPALYAITQTGAVPSAPTITEPAVDAVLSDLTPTFSGLFADSDTALYGDGLRQFQFELRLAGGSVVWTGSDATFTATPEQTASGAFSVEYNGPQLLNDTAYELRARVSDATFTWSPFSGWIPFSFIAEMAVDTSSASPTGKVDGNSAEINWSGSWWNVHNNAADRLQVRVLDNGTVIKVGTEIIQSVAADDEAPGTLFTITAASAGIGALAPGREYQFQIRARDAVSLAYSGWSNPVTFRTNALPTVPVFTAPVSGSVSAERPEVRFLSNDPDADDVEGVGVTWEVAFTEVATGAVRTAIATAYDPSTGEASIAPSSTYMPNPGTYLIRARGQDVSAATYGYSAWSAFTSVTYTAGPAISVTVPANGEVLATTRPIFEWTAVGQTSYRIRIYNTSGVLVQETPITAGSAQTFQPPVGWFSNNFIGDIQIESWVGATLSLSPRIRFSINLAAVPAPTGVVAARVDLISQAVRTSWNPTTLPSSEFVAWIVSRWPTASGPSASVDIATITNPSKLFWDDTSAPSNTILTYGVRQRRLTSEGNRDSSVTVAPQTVAPALQVPVIVAIGDASLAWPVMWLREGLSGEFVIRRSSHQPWGAQGKAFSVTAPGGYNRISVVATIRNDHRGSMMYHFLNLMALVKSGRPVTYRGEHPSEIWTMGFSAPPRWRRGEIVGTREVTLQLEEIAS